MTNFNSNIHDAICTYIEEHKNSMNLVTLASTCWDYLQADPELELCAFSELEFLETIVSYMNEAE